MMYEVPFRGHPNIRSTHRTTTEITTDSHLTIQGDCIVGVSAGSGCAGLPQTMKRALRDPANLVHIEILVGTRAFTLTGRGDPGLDLSHPTDIVIRKSGFVCPRTLAVRCDGASADMPRTMVQDLQAGISGTMRVTVCLAAPQSGPSERVVTAI